MDGFSNELFAGAALALNQNCRPRGRYLSNEVEKLEHQLALADDVFKVVALLESAFELNNLFFSTMPGNSGADVGKQLFVVPGLLDEVLCAGADGIDNV